MKASQGGAKLVFVGLGGFYWWQQAIGLSISAASLEQFGNAINNASAMADTRTKEQRSRIMKSVGTYHTGPELTVRRLLHRLGYRYRLHRRDLPGRPDIVFPGRRKAIFIHGCFWHGHDCSKGKLPKSRTEYWTAKIRANQDRDARAVAG